MVAGMSHQGNRVLAGVDGCRGGWVAVTRSEATLSAMVVESAAELLTALPINALIAIDIPIGLRQQGPRSCDQKARMLLGQPRASSVFPAPIRPILGAASYLEACAIRTAVEQKRMSQQAYAILSKVREVDALLRANNDLQSRVREVHPEVSFAIWNDGIPMGANKKSGVGRLQREQLIDAAWPGVREQLLKVVPRNRVKRDDLNDAFAALWTAIRIDANQAIHLPHEPLTDLAGLRMEIVA